MKRKRANLLPDDDIQYVVTEDGLQLVKEYMCDYKSFAKARWIGQTIIDFFVSEFVLKDRIYYEEAISTGMITVNDRIVDKTYVIKQNDAISHRIRKTEPAVVASVIEIIHSDCELLVVNKPSSIPVHPTGKYRHNTLTHMLYRDHGRLFPVHRLDRLTSGVLMIAKTPAVSNKYAEFFKKGNVSKEYLAKVKGNFPFDEITVNQPLLTACPQSTLNIVHPDGKPSETYFKKLSFDGKYSIIKCCPKTGRTHQIRVHLRWLNFPIANDHIYTNSTLWDGLDDSVGTLDEMVQRAKVYQSNDANPSKYLSLWLHAWRIRVEGQQFEATMPDWAQCENSN